MGKNIIYITILSLLWGCNKVDSLLEYSLDDEVETSTHLLSGATYSYTMDELELDMVEVVSKSGDFFSIDSTSYWTLEIEQNDDDLAREGTVLYKNSLGELQTYQFTQMTKSDSSSEFVKSGFIRNYGLGFSYDAINGGYCEYNSVKCQVLNYDEIEKLEEDIVKSVTFNSIIMENHISKSYSEYVHKTIFASDVDVDLILYQGQFVGKMEVLEFSKQLTIYFTSIEDVTCREQYFDVASLYELLPENLQILTESFRNSISELDSDPTMENMAVFLTKYGSHIVVYSQMGASLQLDVSVNKDCFSDYYTEQSFSKHSVKALFNQITDSSEKESYSQIYESAKAVMSVKGGKSSVLNDALFDTSFNNDNIVSSALTDWVESVVFDPDDYSKNNAEMIDMEIIPIWELIAPIYPSLAQSLENHVVRYAPTLQDLLGTQHFANCSFSANFDNVNCNMGSGSVTIADPYVVNIISSGRYAATVCKEFIPNISQTELVNVAYPIYDRLLHIRSGLAIHNGRAYSVDCAYNRFWVEDLGATSSDKFYMYNGILSAEAVDGVSYSNGSGVIGYEWPGSINIDGSINSTGYLRTRKFIGDFYLENSNEYTNIPNWSYRTSEAPINEEYKNTYSDFFSSQITYSKAGIDSGASGVGNLTNRMVMDSDYECFWNSTEVSPY